MAIEIFNNKIQFSNYSLEFSPSGIKTNSSGTYRGDFAAASFSTISPMEGTVAGFIAGSQPVTNTIQRYPFATDSNATDAGDLDRLVGGGHSAQSSQTSGYASGGFSPTTGLTSNISKFPFATTTTGATIGFLTYSDNDRGAGLSSSEHGYHTGGGFPYKNTIDRFPFASDANAATVGTLANRRSFHATSSSLTHGHVHGGAINQPGGSYGNNAVERFPFASSTSSTNVGSITVGRDKVAGVSSTTHGYSAGGYIPFPSNSATNVIDRFSFSSLGSSTDVGDLTVARSGVNGASSTLSGYVLGGGNIIDKFPFATNANATDVGDMLLSIGGNYRPGATQD